MSPQAASTGKPSISDYGLLGDLHTGALVSCGGSIDWLCLPRFDSGACFASLLGDTEHGSWRLAPTGEGRVALDRAIQAVEGYDLDGPVTDWRNAREEIHASVCKEGYDPHRGIFTRFYGSEGVDAWLLLMPRVGFLPYDDPRVVRTIDAVDHELSRGELLLPLDPAVDDGDQGHDNDAMLLECGFWLVEALACTGRGERAETRFEHLLRLSIDLGLLTEQYDPSRGRGMGNMPHGHAHADLINAAYALR